VDEAPANNVAWKKNQPIAKKKQIKTYFRNGGKESFKSLDRKP
jgi:hypothetical protein